MDLVEAAQREKGHVGNPLFSEYIDHRVIGSVHEIVMVLHANDRCNALRLDDLGSGDIAETEMPDQSPLLKFSQRGEPFPDGCFGRAMHAVGDAQIDHVEHINSEIAKIVVNATHEIGWRLRG